MFLALFCFQGNRFSKLIQEWVFLLFRWIALPLIGRMADPTADRIKRPDLRILPQKSCTVLKTFDS